MLNRSAIAPLLPGLGLAVLVAVSARLMSRILPASVGEVLLALLIGVVVANAVGISSRFTSGIRFAGGMILRIGIVCLGARISIQLVLSIGVGALLLAAAAILVGISVTMGLARLAGIPTRLALLIGVGTGVCGNSAIVATSPLVQAEDREVSFAVGTITLFGLLAVLTYPFIGRLTGMSDQAFGMWTGLAVNDTSQVVVTGAAFSAGALQVATVVKFVRNTLMAPVLVAVAWWWGRTHQVAEGNLKSGIRKAVPWFVIGFLIMSLLRSATIIDASGAAAIDEVARFSIAVGIAAIGMSTRFSAMRAIGWRPFLVGLGASVTQSALAWLAVARFGLGGI